MRFPVLGDCQIDGGDVILSDAQALAVAGKAVEAVNCPGEGIGVMPCFTPAGEVLHHEPAVAVGQIRIFRVFKRLAATLRQAVILQRTRVFLAEQIV